MGHSETDQPQLAARSRTNAALVFGFHSDLRRVPTLSDRPAKPIRRPVLAAPTPGNAGPSSALGWIVQIAKWLAMLAAIAAPWILLLTG